MSNDDQQPTYDVAELSHANAVAAGLHDCNPTCEYWDPDAIVVEANGYLNDGMFRWHPDRAWLKLTPDDQAWCVCSECGANLLAHPETSLHEAMLIGQLHRATAWPHVFPTSDKIIATVRRGRRFGLVRAVRRRFLRPRCPRCGMFRSTSSRKCHNTGCRKGPQGRAGERAAIRQFGGEDE